MKQSILDKIDEIYGIKNQLKEALISKGYAYSDVGNMLEDFPNLIQRMEVSQLLPYPKWFMDSIVCWYSPARQGLTNAQIEADKEANGGQGFTILKDFSPSPKGIDGKPCDMKLYNFDGGGMSGMDGYPFSITKMQTAQGGEFTYEAITENKVRVTKVGAKLSNGMFFNNPPITFNKVIVKIEGLTDGQALRWFSSESKIILSENKKYEIDIISEEAASKGIWGFMEDHGFQPNTACDFTIEILPLYEGALCFDGTDDYGQSKNQPILTDYTIISNRVSLRGYFWSKSVLNRDTTSKEGAFSVQSHFLYNFGKGNNVPDVPSGVSVVTKSEYDGTPIEAGTAKDTNGLNFAYAGSPTSNYGFGKFAFYDFLLFNRTLTPEEIEWVKKNIINKYPSWFLQSLVCWYDPSRQGLTNEIIKSETTQNGYAILKDLNPIARGIDGQKCDMKLYNFDGEGMSAMGGYSVSSISQWADKYSDYQDSERDGDTLIIKSQKKAFRGKFCTGYSPNELPKKTVFKVSGIPEGYNLYYGWDQNEAYPKYKDKLTNGINVIAPQPPQWTGSAYSIFFDTVVESCNVVIEMLPSYEGALCFDGADDHGISENQPILTDYTVIAKRKYLRLKGHFISKAVSNLDATNHEGAFSISDAVTYSFGYENNIVDDKDIIWQTKNTYCGNPIVCGNVIDTNKMNLGLAGRIDSKYFIFKGVLYSILLFNRTLTPEQIEWVKTNIMGEEPTAEPQPTEVEQLN